MSYCKIDDWQKEHLLKLIDFLYNEVGSAGGDGDALWYSKYYNVNDLYNLVKEYNDKTKFKWEIQLDAPNLLWGENQEWVLITNDEDVYNNAPRWQQIIIKY